MNHSNNNTISDWVNIVEKDIDYDKNIKLFVNSGSVQSNIFYQSNDSEKNNYSDKKNIVTSDISDIRTEMIEMISNQKLLSDIMMLEKTSLYTKKIKHQFGKKIDNCDELFITWFTESLELLRDIMFELSNRNSQSINLNQDKKPQSGQKSSITRNSYKFCEFGYGCKFNYEKKQKCHAHHFVFNMVYLDIIDILEYISTVFLNNKTITLNDMNEIKTSVNTITYVLNHMHDELSQLKTMKPECYQNYVNGKYDLNPVLSKRLKGPKGHGPFKKNL